LFNKIKNNQAPWNTGSAEFSALHDTEFGKLVVGIECRIEDKEESYMALLDTGSEWSIIGGEMAHDFEDFPDNGPIVTLNTTRCGNITANLKSLNITLVAKHGDDLLVDSTVMISEEWTGPQIVLGFRGFLEHVRIALDPGINQESSQVFYFGRCE
jgi:hypothetical protein